MRSLDIIAAYLPQVALSSLCEGDASPDAMLNNITPPIRRNIAAACMFVDVSGFTRLASSLVDSYGDQGAEVLARHLNTYLSQVIRIVNSTGGDIVRFAGDALIILWPAGDAGSGAGDAASAACFCAIELQRTLHRATLASGVTLSIRIGLSAGELCVLHVGDSMREVLLVGTALDDAFACAQSAEEGGTTVVHCIAWPLTLSRFEPLKVLPSGAVVITRDGHGTCLVPFKKQALRKPLLLLHGSASSGASAAASGAVAGVSVVTTAGADVLPLLPPASSSKIAAVPAASSLRVAAARDEGDADPTSSAVLTEQLTRYLPRLLRASISRSATDSTALLHTWLSCVRPITCVFANLGFRTDDAHAAIHYDDALLRIHKVVSSAQRLAEECGGEVNKVVFDDKGCTLLAVFGLPSPQASPPCPLTSGVGSAERGVLFSLTLCAQLWDGGLLCSAGVTHGIAFCGTVGSTTRKEYSVLGDAVNVAARLMSKAASTGGGVFVGSCVRTATRGSGLLFIGTQDLHVKGKLYAISASRPYPPQIAALFPPRRGQQLSHQQLLPLPQQLQQQHTSAGGSPSSSPDNISDYNVFAAALALQVSVLQRGCALRLRLPRTSRPELERDFTSTVLRRAYGDDYSGGAAAGAVVELDSLISPGSSGSSVARSVDTQLRSGRGAVVNGASFRGDSVSARRSTRKLSDTSTLTHDALHQLRLEEHASSQQQQNAVYTRARRMRRASLAEGVERQFDSSSSAGIGVEDDSNEDRTDLSHSLVSPLHKAGPISVVLLSQRPSPLAEHNAALRGVTPLHSVHVSLRRGGALAGHSEAGAAATSDADGCCDRPSSNRSFILPVWTADADVATDTRSSSSTSSSKPVTLKELYQVIIERAIEEGWIDASGVNSSHPPPLLYFGGTSIEVPTTTDDSAMALWTAASFLPLFHSESAASCSEWDRLVDSGVLHLELNVDVTASPAEAALARGGSDGVPDNFYPEPTPDSHAAAYCALVLRHSLLASSEHGSGGSVMLRGPPGIGKTHVVHAFLAACCRHTSVLVASAAAAQTRRLLRRSVRGGRWGLTTNDAGRELDGKALVDAAAATTEGSGSAATTAAVECESELWGYILETLLAGVSPSATTASAVAAAAGGVETSSAASSLRASLKPTSAVSTSPSTAALRASSNFIVNRGVLATSSTPAPAAPQDGSLLKHVTATLRRVTAISPLVLVIEDAAAQHHSDRVITDVVRRLASLPRTRPDALPLLLIECDRSREAGPGAGRVGVRNDYDDDDSGAKSDTAVAAASSSASSSSSSSSSGGCEISSGYSNGSDVAMRRGSVNDFAHGAHSSLNTTTETTTTAPTAAAAASALPCASSSSSPSLVCALSRLPQQHAQKLFCEELGWTGSVSPLLSGVLETACRGRALAVREMAGLLCHAGKVAELRVVQSSVSSSLSSSSSSTSSATTQPLSGLRVPKKLASVRETAASAAAATVLVGESPRCAPPALRPVPPALVLDVCISAGPWGALSHRFRDVLESPGAVAAAAGAVSTAAAAAVSSTASDGGAVATPQRTTSLFMRSKKKADSTTASTATSSSAKLPSTSTPSYNNSGNNSSSSSGCGGGKAPSSPALMSPESVETVKGREFSLLIGPSMTAEVQVNDVYSVVEHLVRLLLAFLPHERFKISLPHLCSSVTSASPSLQQQLEALHEHCRWVRDSDIVVILTELRVLEAASVTSHCLNRLFSSAEAVIRTVSNGAVEAALVSQFAAASLLQQMTADQQRALADSLNTLTRRSSQAASLSIAAAATPPVFAQVSPAPGAPPTGTASVSSAQKSGGVVRRASLVRSRGAADSDYSELSPSLGSSSPLFAMHDLLQAAVELQRPSSGAPSSGNAVGVAASAQQQQPQQQQQLHPQLLHHQHRPRRSSMPTALFRVAPLLGAAQARAVAEDDATGIDAGAEDGGSEAGMSPSGRVEGATGSSTVMAVVSGNRAPRRRSWVRAVFAPADHDGGSGSP